MLKKDFWYDLPKELIAQEPASPRDAARLMVLHRDSDAIEHRIFHDLPEYLMPGDLLVVNNSKVLPARIVGVKQPTGAVCELLLLRQVKGDQRSEEHTSELQSRFDLVCRLLLEKKKR